MISDIIFTLASYGYKLTIEPLDIKNRVIGISLYNNGYVNRTCITKGREPAITEELLEWELDQLERSFDALAVKEDNDGRT